MATPKKTNNTSKIPWYENATKRTVAAVSAFLTIAGLGYTSAVIVKNQQFKVERVELRQDYMEKAQAIRDQCREEKQATENKKIENLELVVKDLEKFINAKK
jgi:hypothetical protein